MTQYQIKSIVCVFGCMFICGLGTAYAKVLASEQFDYKKESLNGRDGGAGWAEPWSSNAAILSNDGVSLSFPGVKEVGGRVSDTDLGRSERKMEVPIDFSTNGVFYVGVLISQAAGGSVDFGFSDGKHNRWRWRCNSSGAVSVGIGKSTEATAGTYTSSGALLIVTKLEATAGRDTVSVQFFEQTDSVKEPEKWAASTAGKSSVVVDRLYISGNDIGAQVDSIIIGTTFADVIGSE